MGNPKKPEARLGKRLRALRSILRTCRKTLIEFVLLVLLLYRLQELILN